MAILTVYPEGTAAEVAFQAADAGGDEFESNGEVRLWADNGGGTVARTLTFVEVRLCDHEHHGLVNWVQTVDAGDVRPLGPFQTYPFNAETGRVRVTYSGVTGLLVAAFRYPPERS